MTNSFCYPQQRITSEVETHLHTAKKFTAEIGVGREKIVRKNLRKLKGHTDQETVCLSATSNVLVKTEEKRVEMSGYLARI